MCFLHDLYLEQKINIIELKLTEALILDGS